MSPGVVEGEQDEKQNTQGGQGEPATVEVEEVKTESAEANAEPA